MMAEEQAVRRKREQRAKRREKRRQIRQEDATLADALNAVSVGNEAKKDAPTIGAPLKTDVEMSALKVRRSRIRKPCKKCQERLKKIRARMAKRAAMSIDKDDTNVTNNNNVMA
ncbi:hypothetical protein BWQ96_02784 [Gracilariopsis chorda]|uniref:Uncharacterized protein n=1 Tax=Gracilariopsis chorda TaxID=448386 RepID=A0A2V3IZH7_9FLOR|nr:hypothetical protein BWQ96_02784 [Gracilariopsis chorda]|eukprot:PXF47453.1 hypothetical protein BWQ96_02784 [Gracilariopsis chorda]